VSSIKSEPSLSKECCETRRGTTPGKTCIVATTNATLCASTKHRDGSTKMAKGTCSYLL